MKYALPTTLLGSILLFSGITTALADTPEKDPNAPLSSIHFTPSGLVVIDEDGNVETIKGSVIIIDNEKAIAVDDDGNAMSTTAINKKNSVENTAFGKSLTSPAISTLPPSAFRCQSYKDLAGNLVWYPSDCPR